jgi:hypothetical protein
MTVAAPAGWTCDAAQVGNGTTSVACSASAIAPDASAAFAVQAVVPPALVNGTVTLAVATQAQSLDPASGNNRANATIGITGQADLSMAVSGPAKKLHYGRVEAFPLTLRNAGPDAAWQPVVTLIGDAPAANVAIDAPAGWACTVNGEAGRFAAACRFDGSLASGVSAGFNASIRIPARPDSTRFLTLQATAASATPDTAGGDNSADYANRIVGVP